MSNNQDSGLEYVEIYIPLDDETRAERQLIISEEELNLRGYARQINNLKKELKPRIKAASDKKDQASTELEMGQFLLKGDFMSYPNEITRRMEYYDKAGVLVANRPLSPREVRQFKIDFKETVAQN